MKKAAAKSGKPASANQAPKKTPPFKKAGSGIEAHGHVSGLSDTYDGDAVRMTVKHGKPKRGGDGILSTYPDESNFTIPSDAAQQFTHGQRVRIRVHPHDGAPGKSTKAAKPAGKKKAPRQLYAD